MFAKPPTIVAYNPPMMFSAHPQINDRLPDVVFPLPPPINDCVAPFWIVLYSHPTIALDTEFTVLFLPTIIALFLSLIVLSDPQPINDTLPPLFMVLCVPHTMVLRSNQFDLLYAPHTATLPLFDASLYKPPHINAAYQFQMLLSQPTTDREPLDVFPAHIICADCGEPAPYCHGHEFHPPPSEPT